MIKAFKTTVLDFTEEFEQKLIQMEEILGEELIITSGYRSPEHPVEAKKKTPGSHSRRVAADVVAIGGSATLSIVETALKVGIRRIGINRNRNFVHLDIDDRVESIWTYNS